MLYWQVYTDCAGFPVLISKSRYHIRPVRNPRGGSKQLADIYDEHFTPIKTNLSMAYAKRWVKLQGE